MFIQIKKELASEIHRELKNFSQEGVDLSEDTIYKLIEAPKKIELGQLALPVFLWAKSIRKAPPVIAQEWVVALKNAKINNLQDIQAVGGYINFKFSDSYLLEHLFLDVQNNGEKIGNNDFKKGRRAVIDFASPNVAKPMHIGHLRATVIGQAICNLAKAQGLDVVGLNHLGDWGVQFGKLAWAYKTYVDPIEFNKKPFENLYELYVRFHKEAEINPAIEAEGAREFKKLEDGDQELKKLWKQFVDVSLAEYQRTWDRMQVKHDLVVGESFYNDRLKPVEDELTKKKLLELSDGAMVVKLEEINLPPCLIRKSDGASLYATRDLASADYRHNELKGDLLIYVVGAEQSLHFQQVFAVLKKMGRDWAKDCYHVSFGIYLFKDEKMSSRKGQVIQLNDLIERSIQKVSQVIEQKNPSLKNKEVVAEQVGIGAIIFNDLVNDRQKNVDFSWEKALSFEGDSGPYVQYSLVRCKSIIRKYGKKPALKVSASLSEPSEKELTRLLLSYDQILQEAFNNLKPHVVCHYLLDVCRAFSQFYNQCRILGEEKSLEETRLGLVLCTEAVLQSGLKVLNIARPEEM